MKSIWLIDKIMSLLILIVLSSLIMICCTSYNDLQGEYDNNFVSRISSKALPNVNDEDYDQSAMLDFCYVVNSNSYLSIYAPLGAVSYRWEMSDIALSSSVDTGSRLFKIYVDGSFSVNTVYKIKLTVVTESGRVLEDTAKVIVSGEEQ